MTRPALLAGVDEHHGSYRVRVYFKSLGGRHIETGISTADEANTRVLELRKLRAAGLVPTTPSSGATTLRAAADAYLAKARVTNGRAPRTIDGLERSCKPWRDGLFADRPLDLLRRAEIEDEILARAAEHPTSARNELQAIKGILNYAAERDGAKFDPAILLIERIAVQPRRRKAIEVGPLELLAESAPVYARSLVLLKGTAGFRINELFTLTDDRVDLAGARIFIPAALAKERRDKWVGLDPQEVALVRRQLLARAPGTALVFPTRDGKRWRYSAFRRLVWDKAVERADTHWRRENRLGPAAASPFRWPLLDAKGGALLDEHGVPKMGGLAPNDLRSTAATLMRDQGFPREATAARLGHIDSGKLLDRVYDQGDRQARVEKAIATYAPDGLRAAAGGGS